MHSFWTRLNAIFFYAVTALFALSVASAITTIWMPPTFTVAALKINALKALKPQEEDLRNGRSVSRDRAVAGFDLDADLSGVFNWNVKQLFVFIKVTFETKTNSLNEVVLWDKIVTRREDAHLQLGGARSWAKYPIIDQRTELRGRLLNVSLHWDVMPYTGLMYFGGAGKYVAQLPTAYCMGPPCPLTEVAYELPLPAASLPERATAREDATGSEL